MNKKIVLFIATLGIVGLLGSRVSAYQQGGAAGTTDAGRAVELLWVHNDDAVAHEAGDVVVWHDGSYDGIGVSTSVTANSSLVAGVVPYGYTLPASDWGFIQTHGYHPAITIAVANSAGDSLVTSTTAEAAGVATIAAATTTVTAQVAVFATALEATTSSTTVKGFIIK